MICINVLLYINYNFRRENIILQIARETPYRAGVACYLEVQF